MAARTNSTPICASCTSGHFFLGPGEQQGAETGCGRGRGGCTCQPPGASSSIPATMTPRAGDLRDRQVDEDDALAQHLRTQGHVGREHQHAGGERRQQDREVDGGPAHFAAARSKSDSVLSKRREQIGGLVVAADGEGKDDVGDGRACSESQREARGILVRAAHHHLRRLRRQLRLELGSAARRWARHPAWARACATSRTPSQPPRDRSCSCGVRRRAARAAAAPAAPTCVSRRSSGWRRTGTGPGRPARSAASIWRQAVRSAPRPPSGCCADRAGCADCPRHGHRRRCDRAAPERRAAR